MFCGSIFKSWLPSFACAADNPTVFDRNLLKEQNNHQTWKSSSVDRSHLRGIQISGSISDACPKHSPIHSQPSSISLDIISEPSHNASVCLQRSKISQFHRQNEYGFLRSDSPRTLRIRTDYANAKMFSKIGTALQTAAEYVSKKINHSYIAPCMNMLLICF